MKTQGIYLIRNAMVERVARALCDKGMAGTDDCTGNRGTCLLPHLRDAARAAIAAMRVPSAEVSRALFFGLDAPGIIGARMPADIAALWAKAIDAALNEPRSE